MGTSQQEGASSRPGISPKGQRALVVGGGVVLLAAFEACRVVLPLSAEARHVALDIGWSVASAVASVLCLAASRASAPGAARRAWAFFAAGCFSWLAGMLVWTWIELVQDHLDPFPSLADPLYMAMAPLFAVGLATFRSTARIDAVTLRRFADVGFAASTLALILLVSNARAVIESDASHFAVVTGIAYPVLFVPVFFLALGVLWTTELRGSRLPLCIVTIALGLEAFAKLQYPAMAMGHADEALIPLAPIFLVFFVLIAWAALEQVHARSAPGSSVATQQDVLGLSGLQALLPAACALAASSAVVYWFRDFSLVRPSHLLACCLCLAAFSGLRGWCIRRTARQMHEQAVAREAELRHAQALDALGRLAGGVAHDFNNVLTGILGHADFAAEQLPPESPLRRDLDVIREGARRAAELTRRLLMLARRPDARVTAFDLNASVREALSLLKRSLPPEVELVTELDASLPPTLGDPGGVTQAVLNLGINAREAMPRGGALTVRTCKVAPEGEDEGHLVIEVTDTGEGIDPAIRDRIFEPFFTTRPPGKGSGLGLSMVHAIARAHGGRVELDSTPGRGSSFRLLLAAVPAKLPVREAGAELPKLPAVTVLVVDDAPHVRDTTRRMLERAGCRVLVASDGEEGLRVLRERCADVALVVTDMVMPRLDGKGLLRAARAEGIDVPFLGMSGYADHVTPESAREAGFVELIAKPYEARTLLAAAQAALADGAALREP